ncbi:hypothetical protein BDY17DRAFT_328002 [Neohortaea acidophila]|uniref:Centrosomin N-terminal motif 1 domain-containing protein n=1 Tax=Neohortaea acidophila TaxID=245834 RepID=A0A6A6PH32_9PEZI|nr:uncharacterized protein BDY17DRAFT_328002 [Neohortaea acidophila]KAF2479225.1 hypothetical protein BDY17DRAFT_328002 [Neohortaea acidophila]
METTHGSSHRADREETPDVFPTSRYLQERLHERRTRNVRPKRLRQSDFGPQIGRDDDIFINEADESRNTSTRAFDSSPLVNRSRDVAEHSDSGRTRGLGAKGMHEHMDRLTKENFALKLELDHRREQQSKLQEKIEGMRLQAERAEHLLEEHTELLKINSQLVEELEKRDRAVEEAMDIICDLEDKVADLEERNSVTRPSTANADSGYAGTETQEQGPPSSPPELSKPPKTPQGARDAPPPVASAATNRLLAAVNGKTLARTRREPHVLSHKKASTTALRSVYLEATQSLHPVQSFQSLLTKQDNRSEDGEDVLHSPRLSVLSESSFPSLYSPKEGMSPSRYAAETYEPSPHHRQDSIKRVSQWMNEREINEQTPSKSNQITSPLLEQMASPLAKQNINRQSPNGIHFAGADSANHASLETPQPVEYIKPFAVQAKSQLAKESLPTSLGGPMFGEPLLPPTPESASTRTLDAFRSSMNDERSILDSTPATVRGYDALEPGLRTAPKQMRSSVELNTAYQSYVQRREDQGLGFDMVNGVHDGDIRSEAVRDLGAPSRFLQHAKPFAAPLARDGYDAPAPQTRTPPFPRRQSSSEPSADRRKPHLNRAETSPQMHHAYEGSQGLHSSHGSLTSPRSYTSGSSSNRTLVQPSIEAQTASPDFSRSKSQATTRASPSPARTFGQRAHGLLRRLSNSHSREGVPLEREKSPALPTLTSAPSSTYINDLPKEARRPGTSYSGASELTAFSRPPLQSRMNTAPPSGPVAPAPPPTFHSLPINHGAERKNPFRRSNSTKQGPPLSMSVMHADSNGGGPPHAFLEGSCAGGLGMRGLLSRRRGSIKDAVSSAARRPWKWD